MDDQLDGYGQASLARIAERGGTSNGVITYHFAGQDELIGEVIGSCAVSGPLRAAAGSCN
jgi:TetR/AcrR family transcriptional regulator, fatty acid metabolism regulator protein